MQSPSIISSCACTFSLLRDFIFSANGEFEISEMIVANSESEINVSTINDFSLSAAYPNPFNPSTSFNINVPEAGNLNIKVYNVSGQMVDVIANGFYGENTHSFTWNASNTVSYTHLTLPTIYSV